jgi:hypothetical protein
MDDARFEQWWSEVGLPQMMQHMGRIIVRQFQDKARQGAKATWDAALSWNKQTEQPADER